MKAFERILCVILALFVLVPVAAIPASASSGVISASSETAHRGDTVMIDISVTGNPGVVTMVLDVNYSDGLELIDVRDGGVLPGQKHSPGYSANPYRLTCEKTDSAVNFTGNGTLATLTFRVKEDADISDHSISISPAGFGMITDKDLGEVFFSFSSGKITVECTHDFGDWQKDSETEHKRICSSCGKTETEAHSWDDGTDTTPATHLQTGIRTYTCIKCGETKTDTIPKKTGHEYGDWEKYDETQHKRDCPCGDVDYAAHNWNEGEITTPSTCNVEGVRTFTCNDCGETRTEPVAKSDDHSFGPWQKDTETQHKHVCSVCSKSESAAHKWNSGEITTPATCSIEGVKTFTCTECGETKTEPVARTEDHNFGEWQKDTETRHKHVCSACNKTEYAGHRWNSGEITVQPTHQQKGEKMYTCNDCGETKTEEIPVLTNHIFGEWQKDSADKHKRSCICGETQYADHEWNEGRTLSRANCNSTGEIIYTCNDCGETKIETTPKTEDHAYGDWVSTGTQQHSRTCSRCGKIQSADHTWNDGEILIQPTHEKKGEKTVTCTECGEKKNEELPVLTDHSYGNWEKHDEKQHKRSCVCGDTQYAAHEWDEGRVTTEPTCSTAGELTYTCASCGQTKTESVPKGGNHTFGPWSKDTEKQHKHTCTLCGKTEKAAHNWDTGAVTTLPTHDDKGIRTFTCTECGQTRTEDVPVLTEHSYGAWVNFDESRHKRSCVCGDTEYAAHEWDNGVITTPATHENEGVRTYSCICGATRSEPIQKLPGHEFGEWESFDGQQHARHCGCGETEYGPHDFGEWKITKQATKTEEGEESRTCGVCGAEDHRSIDKTGGSDVQPVVYIIAGAAAMAVIIAVLTIILVRKKKKA